MEIIEFFKINQIISKQRTHTCRTVLQQVSHLPERSPRFWQVGTIHRARIVEVQNLNDSAQNFNSRMTQGNSTVFLHSKPFFFVTELPHCFQCIHQYWTFSHVHHPRQHLQKLPHGHGQQRATRTAGVPGIFQHRAQGWTILFGEMPGATSAKIGSGREWLFWNWSYIHIFPVLHLKKTKKHKLLTFREKLMRESAIPAGFKTLSSFTTSGLCGSEISSCCDS